MAFAYEDIQSEILRRALRNQGGGNFTTAIANAANTAMWTIARSAKWRTLRRNTTFNTVTTYSTGTGAATLTKGSTAFSVTGATFLTDNIRVGRFIKFDGSVIYFKIATITSETAGTLDQIWDGANTTTAGYAISPQEEYVLPIQIGHSAFLWHRKYGMPKIMKYIPTYNFYAAGVLDILTNIPVTYRMWGVDSNLEQVKTPSVLQITSSSTTDKSIAVTVFGTVCGLGTTPDLSTAPYPDYEIISTDGTDGTTAVNGSKIFSSIERIVKNQTTTGRITVTANSEKTIVSVLPIGNTTTGPIYTKIQLYPLPNSVFPINVFYYKLPYQMVNAGDVPEIGEEFAEAIILLATGRIKAEQNMATDAGTFLALYEKELESLKSSNVDKIDWKIVLKTSGDGDNDQWTGGLRYAQIGGSGQYGGSWSP